MTDDCKHEAIFTYRTEDGQSAGLWGCADCARKFVPLDLTIERDAARYRWLRERDWCESEIVWHLGLSQSDDEVSNAEIDAAIDAAMKG